MPVYVMGHGIWDIKNTDQPWARVPPSTSVTFYADNLHNLYFINGIEVFSLDNIVGDGGDTREAGNQCPNYLISKLEPNQKDWYDKVDPGGNDVIFIGYDSEFAEDEYHLADIFASPRVQGQQLVWLACQGVQLDSLKDKLVAEGDQAGLAKLQAMGLLTADYINTGQQALGVGSGSDTIAWDDAATQHQNFCSMDPATWQDHFDNVLDAAQQQQVRTYPDVETWYQIREGLWVLANSGDEGFEQHFNAQTAPIQEMLRTEPQLQEALERQTALAFAELPGEGS